MIAVAGGKGGSGKTTTTLGLARSLASRRITDRYTRHRGTDPGRNDRNGHVESSHASGLGAGPIVAVDADWDLPNLASLADSTEGVRSADRSAVSAHPATVGRHTEGAAGPSIPPEPAVLSAPADPAEHDPVTVLTDLDRKLDDATMLVDCPAGASPDAAAPFRVADGCVLVTPLCAPALRDTAKTAALARALGCPVHGVVVTRAASAPDGVADLLDCPILGSVPAAPPTPLADAAVERAYDRVADRLVSTRWASEGPTDPNGRTDH